MPNELTVGTRRVGEFIDFYPETPSVKVTLERSESGINVTLPWSEPDSPYAQWFMAKSGMRRLPSGPDPLPVPKRVLFHDSHGSVLLIRCWARGFHSSVFGPGSGTLWARAAIMGVDDEVEFDCPHGLQTEISGLRAWLGVSSWKEEHAWADSPPVTTLTSQHLASIEVGQYKGVSLDFQPNWQVVPEESRDRSVLLDLLRVVTRSAEPLAWDEHCQLHRAVRDLLVLSRWRAESCVEVLALRNDDPLRTLDGKTHGAQWRSVIVSDDERAEAPSGYRPHLLPYDKLQAAGILRWLELRDGFSRALDPVISSVDLRGVTANTLLAHTGPGLEALGYLLMLRDGSSEGAAARATLRSRLERVLQDVSEVLPFDGPTWVTTTTGAYNGLKHANRAEPDPLVVVNAWRESVMVVRAWVAVELGVAREDVKAQLEADPQSSAFVKRE